MMVHKFGRTTSYTVGRVDSIDTDVIVEYETGEFTFDNQIIIRETNHTMFSDSGDSGSLILQRGTNTAVGLLFGGGPGHTIANHIGDVLRSLRVCVCEAMATEATGQGAETRVSRRLLRLRGVNGVGIERADGPTITRSSSTSRTTIPPSGRRQTALADKAVRIVASGKFKKLIK